MMHARALFAIGLIVCPLLSSIGHAEPRRPPAKATAAPDTIRYFQFFDGLLGDLPVDAFLREVRRGGQVVSAVLDACHSISHFSPRKDRFVVPLKFENGRLIGAGESQEDKAPITINLAQRQTGQTVAFEGFITRGPTKTAISSADNTPMNEKDFQNNQTTELLIVGQPSNFTEVSPDSVAVRVKRESLIDLVKDLRSHNVQVVIDSLSPDCASLRSGQQIVNLYVDPERAPALVAKLKTSAGVLAAGWTEGFYSVERAVQLAAAAWRSSGGKLDKERLASAIATTAGKAFGATFDSSLWDATTGELTLKLKRRDHSIPSLPLTNTITITALVGPEKLSSNQDLVIWLNDTTIESVDEGPEPRVKLIHDGDNDTDYTTALIAALARDLNGRTWDSEKSAWK